MTRQQSSSLIWVVFPIIGGVAHFILFSMVFFLPDYGGMPGHVVRAILLVALAPFLLTLFASTQCPGLGFSVALAYPATFAIYLPVLFSEPVAGLFWTAHAGCAIGAGLLGIWLGRAVASRQAA